MVSHSSTNQGQHCLASEIWHIQDGMAIDNRMEGDAQIP